MLGLFASERPEDRRPRTAVDAVRAWARGEMPMMRARALGGHAMGAARPLQGAARWAAYAAGQAACVGHVAEHDLGAAAYALKAVRSAHGDDALRRERTWQRDRLPADVRELVLEDQGRRDPICWSVFSL
ncbi:putative immunity protein [Brachybacterium sp. AOP43-C2-M15]|uniref:putative immunity protein n=1 Tax=Brachybacterium sp. AOP43-C2-M15 TaxID=3457661 RepID=UPI004033F045